MRRLHACNAAAFLSATVLFAGCSGSSSGPTPRASATPSSVPTQTPSPTSSATPTPSPTPVSSPTPTAAPTAPPALSSFRYYLFGGGPNGIIATKDGNVWVIQTQFNDIAYLTPSGQTASFPVLPSGDTTAAGVSALTTGSDGTIWTANKSDESVSNISLTGALLSRVPIGTSVGPVSIAFGSDDRLWFTQSQTPSIVGALTQAGAYTGFAQSQDVGSIIAGPDGNLWLLSPQLGVTRLTPAGVSSYFPDPTGAIAGPLSVGSDGNIWAGTYGTSTGAAAIEKITTGGAYTTYDLPGYLGLSATNPSVGWITATLYASGPDGFVYFDEAKNDGEPNIVGQLTTSGELRQLYAVPETGPEELITSMTMASDGDLYFIDAQSQAIDVWLDPASLPASQTRRTSRFTPSPLFHVHP